MVDMVCMGFFYGKGFKKVIYVLIFLFFLIVLYWLLLGDFVFFLKDGYLGCLLVFILFCGIFLYLFVCFICVRDGWVFRRGVIGLKVMGIWIFGLMWFFKMIVNVLFIFCFMFLFKFGVIRFVIFC